MYDDSFGDYLRRTCPHLPEKEAMIELVIKCGGIYKEVARYAKVSPVTVSRWGIRLGVTPPRRFIHMEVSKALLKEGGGRWARDKLLALKEEEGTWIRVAVRLGVTNKELQKYRYLLKIVPRDVFKARCDMRGLFDLCEDIYEQR